MFPKKELVNRSAMRSLAGNDENERGEKKEKESLSGDFFFSPLSFIETHRV